MRDKSGLHSPAFLGPSPGAREAALSNLRRLLPMKIILLPGESIYAVLNGQVAHISAAMPSTFASISHEDDSEEEKDDCDCSDGAICDKCRDSPGCWCHVGTEACCADTADTDEEDDPFDEESWSEGYDQGFLDGLDFSDQSDECSPIAASSTDCPGCDNCSPSEEHTDETDMTAWDNCPGCAFFDASGNTEVYFGSSHSHTPDCSKSHEVN